MNKYPYLEKFSRRIGIDKNDLVEAFEIEKQLHFTIINENNKEERIKLYSELYSKVHPIYNRSRKTISKTNVISRKAFLYKKELQNKSILDIGCGQGDLLKTISNSYKYKSLTGIDVSPPSDEIIKQYQNIEFIKTDVTDFDLGSKFDIIYSNHVLEHMAPKDIDSHMKSIVNSLNKNGILIINMPNRLFGPSDVTRIIDFTYTNKIEALGSHLSESTYNEMVLLLKKYGFKTFKTVIPHTKLRHLFPSIRINPNILCNIENSKRIMNFLYSIRCNKTCIAKFEISLIATL